eukprot:3628129-Amphidinium_carterae.1
MSRACRGCDGTSPYHLNPKTLTSSQCIMISQDVAFLPQAQFPFGARLRQFPYHGEQYLSECRSLALSGCAVRVLCLTPLMLREGRVGITLEDD